MTMFAEQVRKDLQELVKLGSKSAAKALAQFDAERVKRDYAGSGMSVSDVSDLLMNLVQ